MDVLLKILGPFVIRLKAETVTKVSVGLLNVKVAKETETEPAKTLVDGWLGEREIDNDPACAKTLSAPKKATPPKKPETRN